VVSGYDWSLRFGVRVVCVVRMGSTTTVRLSEGVKEAVEAVGLSTGVRISFLAGRSALLGWRLTISSGPLLSILRPSHVCQGL